MECIKIAFCILLDATSVVSHDKEDRGGKSSEVYYSLTSKTKQCVFLLHFLKCKSDIEETR